MYVIPVNYMNNRETFPFWRRGLIDIKVASVDNSNVEHSISFATYRKATLGMQMHLAHFCTTANVFLVIAM